MVEVKNAVGVDVEGDGDGHTSIVRPGYGILDHRCSLRVISTLGLYPAALAPRGVEHENDLYGDLLEYPAPTLQVSSEPES